MRAAGIVFLLVLGLAATSLRHPSTTSAATGDDPLRPTFSGSIVAPRTTTVGPNGAPAGTSVGGYLDAAIRDVTGDGVPDLIAAGRAGDSVAGTPAVFVHPGRGDGTFLPPVVTPCSASGASRIRVARLDDDAEYDVVLGGPGVPATFSVLRGHGNGSFTELSTFQVDTPALAAGAGLDIGFFDEPLNDLTPPRRPALPDIAIAGTGGQVAVFLNRGRGIFLGPNHFPTGGTLTDLDAEDLDGDGNTDLLVVDGATGLLVPLAGNGDGTFATQAPFPGATTPDRILVADIVGDGRPEIISSGAIASVLTATAPYAYTGILTGGGPGLGLPAVVDFENDLDPDILLGLPGSVLLGNGAGTFAPAAPGLLGVDIGSSGYPAAPAANLDGDGWWDVVTLTGGGSIAADYALTPLLGRFSRLQNPHVASLAMAIPGSGTPVGVVVADADGDGLDDVATAFTSTADGLSYVVITYSAADGSGPTLSQAFPIGAQGVGNLVPSDIAAADFDGDGTDDLVVTANLPGTLPIQIAVLFGSRQRAPGAPLILPSNLPSAAGLAGLDAVSVGDVDGNGFPDIVAFEPPGAGAVPPPSRATVFLSDGLGGFNFAGFVPAARLNRANVPVVDVDGDGRADVVLRVSPTSLWILPGTVTGLPGLPRAVGIPLSNGLGATDLDGDGRVDLIVYPAAATGSDVTTLTSLGGFAFGPGITSPVGAADIDVTGTAKPPVFADWNGDGRIDFATDGGVGANVGVFVQRGDGTFIHLSLASMGDGLGIAGGDFDADGRPDLTNVAMLAGSPIFHEWWRNTTAAPTEIRSVDRAKVRRGEIVTVDCRLRNVRPGFHADLGADVVPFRYEDRGDGKWRIHVLVTSAAAPGNRDLVIVQPDGDEGATGRDGTRSAARGTALKILEDEVTPTLRKLKYPDRERGYLPAGHEDFKLKLRGEGFGPGGRAFFGDIPVETKEPTDKGEKVSARIPAELVAEPGLYEVSYENRVGPGTGTIRLTVIGPEIDEGTSRWRDDGSLRVEVRGRNILKSGFAATVRRLDTGTAIPLVKAKRSSKKKVKLTLSPATPLPAGTGLEVIVSYRGSLGNTIESVPFTLPSP